MAYQSKNLKVAFLNLYLGGTGLGAGKPIADLHAADGRPFPMAGVYIDTDPQPAPHVDHSILIPLDGQKSQTILASPKTFGPVVEIIVEHYRHLLNPEDIQNGARTIRLLTQLAFIYYRESILRGLNRAILDLKKRGEFDFIVPMLISSSGGGTGSALQILLPQALKDPWFASRLTEGLPAGILQTPVLFVVEPYAYALRNQEMHANKILANAYAFRMESVLLEKKHAFKYCYHLGLAGPGGAVLDSPDEVAMVLGASVYQFERSWSPIKGRKVDTVDTQVITSHYGGDDVPENFLAEQEALVAELDSAGFTTVNPM